MFLNTAIQGVDRLVHNGLVYKAIEGVINVPHEVHNEIGSFGIWQPVTEPLDKKLVASLEKSKPEPVEDVTAVPDGDPEPTTPDDPNANPPEPPQQ